MVNKSIYKYLCRRLRHAFIMKDPLLQYYLHQAGRGLHGRIGPIYSVPPFLPHGHELGSFLSGLLRLVRPVLWSGVMAVGRETLRTGARILSDLADNMAGDVEPRPIIPKHVGDSEQILIQKLRCNGRKRTATPKSRGLPTKKKARTKATKTTKRTSLHRTYHSVTDHGRGLSVGKHRVPHLRY